MNSVEGVSSPTLPDNLFKGITTLLPPFRPSYFVGVGVGLWVLAGVVVGLVRCLKNCAGTKKWRLEKIFDTWCVQKIILIYSIESK